MVIEHNMSAMNVQRQINSTDKRMNKSSEKLSSGYQINRSADDAAGLQISNKMRQQIRGLNRGADNIQDGKSLVDVADGALEEIHSILQRMNELSVQAANDTNVDADREALQAETDQLAAEIDRIGRDTTFNDMHILDDAFSTDFEGSLTKLVHCKAADTGYLTEAIQNPANSKWYAAANLDFSGINAKNIGKLDGKGFSFTCSVSCEEVFEFKFVMDGSGGKAENLNGRAHHMYTVDIKGCKTGAEVVQKLFDYVKANPPSLATTSSVISGGIGVSHSNDMIMNGATLTVFKNSSGKSTKEAAEALFANRVGTDNPYAAIDASQLTKITDDELINEFHIQCSSLLEDYQTVTTHRIKANLLGVDELNLKSHTNASKAITTVQGAIDKISGYRSELGAYTNRLEKAYNNVCNNAENTQNAESRIADTDMAEEITNYSREKLLLNVGTTILAQANSNQDGVLQLLQ